jgi:beta-glucosidase
MNNRKFIKIWVSILSVLIILAVVTTIVANMFSAVLDSYLGRGDMHISYAEGTEDWNTEYYSKEKNSLKDAKKYSDTISQQVTDEGIVLLKNNGILPLEKDSEVTPFGYAYLNPAYSGTGAAKTTDTDIVTVEQGVDKYFTINDAAIKTMKSSEPEFPDAAQGTRAIDSDDNSLQAMMDKGNSAKIYEYNPSIYSGIEDNIEGTVGLVFINRNGSEGIDKRYEAYEDGTPHYLALTQNERDTIKFAKENCGKVVVILNTANPMELTPIMTGEYEADAILWIGTTGAKGFDSMGKILSGIVNPSGRLTDIYATDFTKDPTYVNFGEFNYTNSKVRDTTTLNFIPGANKGTIDRRFVEYEEGIYVGYRYYETADVVDPSFEYGELNEYGGIKTLGAVAYPFGYGLSYTNFTQKITDFDATGDNVKVTVNVTNTGSSAGKDVVQIYYTAPYTEYDIENKVEKSSTVLAGFAKTDIIDPGKTDKVTIEFPKEDMASYNYNHKNNDGTTGCYMLEKGEYKIELKKNSHDVIESRSLEINKTEFYQGDNLRNSDKKAQSALDANGDSLGYPANGKSYVAASNQFETMNEYMSDNSITQLSRSDWTNTFPTMPVDRKEAASQVALDEFARSDEFNVDKDIELGNVKESKVYTSQKIKSNQNNGLNLIDMRGLDYYDEAWNRLLDQIDWASEKDSIQKLLFNAAFQTGELKSIGKPATTDKDGAMGWSIDGASAWASANLMASTWNRKDYKLI